MTDVVSYNHYFGWYRGEVGQNAVWLDQFHEMHPEIALGLSEYGAENIPTLHSAQPMNHDYTEEYAKGTIFEQSIEKGSNYEKGTELTLKISMGPAKVMVPEFYGLNKKDYFDLLNSCGIKYEEKAYETENTLHDYVSWISIEPGEYIDLEAGEVLSVFVAVNPENTAPSETTTVTTEAPVETTSAWVTTTVPDITVFPEVTEDPADITEEPDITIIYDY